MSVNASAADAVPTDAINAPFKNLVHRKTNMADAIAAEDHPMNPWTSPTRPRSTQYFEIRKLVRALPAATRREDFIELYQTKQVIILTGDTGSGKTTQIPQFILYMDKPRAQQIVCTQPRRVEAREIAKRVAVELDVDLGQEVGYSLRHEEDAGQNTRLIYKTDGRLLVELHRDPLLKRYSCVVIDEAHERTESTDLLLGFIKPILKKRADLKLIIMSATMRTKTFQDYFDGAPIFEIPGRTFPVDILHPIVRPGVPETMVRCVEYMVSAVQTILHIHRKCLEGDILVFVTGKEDIMAVIEALEAEIHPAAMAILPLYSTQPKSEQEMALCPDSQGRRRCIVATNIAETSLTIDGVRHVIDCGLQEGMSYNPRLRSWTTKLEPISQDSAKQRASRAGHTAPGTCWRLYTKWCFDNILIRDPLPQLLRGDMAGPIMDILSIARTASSISTFDWIDKPSPEAIMRTWYDLQVTGCIGKDGLLTPFGDKVHGMPLEPRHAMALLRALEVEQAPVWEVAAIVALLNEDDLFVRPTHQAEWADIIHERQSSAVGDHFTLLNIWAAFTYQRKVVCKGFSDDALATHMVEWCRIEYLKPSAMQAALKTFDSIINFMDKTADFTAVPAPPHVWGTPRWHDVIRKVLLAANFTQVAVRDPRSERGYLTLEENQPVLMHPGSSLAWGEKYDFVFYDKFTHAGRDYLVNATGFDPMWLFNDNPLVAAFMSGLINDPPRRSGNWQSLAQLRLVYDEWKKLSTAVNVSSEEK